jgi:hypothetical protein
VCMCRDPFFLKSLVPFFLQGRRGSLLLATDRYLTRAKGEQLCLSW